MAITLDSSSISGTNWPASAVSSISWNHTTSTGATVLGVVIWQGGNADIVTSVTYNGVALTRNIAYQDTTDPTLWNYVYYLVSPPLGTFSIQVNVSPSFRFVIGYGETLIGAGAPNASSGYDSGVTTITNPSAPVSVVTANSWLIALFRGGSSPTATTGVVRQNASPNTATIMMDSNGVVGTGTQSLAFTSSISDQYNGVIAAFPPSTPTSTQEELSTIFPSQLYRQPLKIVVIK